MSGKEGLLERVACREEQLPLKRRRDGVRSCLELEVESA